jgi:homoserine kinase
VSKLRGTGLPAVVSGAGPTVLVLARTPAEVGAALEQAPEGWRAEQVAVAATGAHLVR